MFFIIFYKFLFFLSDFLKIQRKSFRRFLKNQFGEEFAAIPRSLNILYKEYKFVTPTLNIEESILLSKTYCCHFYIPVQVHPNFSKIQWFFLGTLPLLTRRGHFIINGTPRIVLNQIVRSPGVYFNSIKMGTQKVTCYYAEIISKRGPWIRLEMDLKYQLWVSIQGQLKMPFFSFFENLCSKTLQHHFFLQEKKKNFSESKKQLLLNSPQNLKDAVVWNPNILLPENKRTNLEILPLLDLGTVGRRRLNKKCGIFIKTSNLTPLDFLTIREKLYKYTKNDTIRQGLDDIDNLKNRHFKTIGELIQNELARGLKRFIYILKQEKMFETSVKSKHPSEFIAFKRFHLAQAILQKRKKYKYKSLEIKKASEILNCQPINSAFKEFFHSHQLSQYLDQSNPLSEITHKRRLSCLGSGGVNRDTAGMEIRGIHKTHYGRICPIETPEGKNAGLVNSLTTAVHLHPKGVLETPFIEIYKQHFQNQKKLYFYSVENQDQRNVLVHAAFPKSKKNLSVAALQAKKSSFQKCSIHSIDLIALTSQQFISIATTCIPFIEHNDANRALMGSNMQRQALPLIHKIEQPLVNTFNSFRVLSDLKDIPTTSTSGKVVYVSRQKITLHPSKNDKNIKGSKIANTMCFFENFAL